MGLYNKIISLYPLLKIEDFTDTIRIQDDQDGEGEYIAKWDHPDYPEPTPGQLAGIT